jgi:glyoxylase-like metal-dependent hydrolase (beta-lactamase superfamily II)
VSDRLPDPVVKVVKQAGDVRIHTFVSPEAFLANATHVIEGPHELVVIDGQFVVPFAKAFRGYVDSLGKPINRVYLSHEHPDHFFGISAAFGDTEVYALPDTIAFLKANGEEIRKARAAVYGGFVPASVVIPRRVAVPGRVVIDGIALELVVFTDGEVKTQLAIKLPDLSVYIVQDLIYSGGHLYLHDLDQVKGWIDILEELKASGYETFLPGHGEPADRAEVQANIDYLKTAVRIAKGSAGVDAYKAAVLAAYPSRIGAAIIDIYAPMLFPDKSQPHGKKDTQHG